jgi:general secretion pathway protein D
MTLLKHKRTTGNHLGRSLLMLLACLMVNHPFTLLAQQKAPAFQPPALPAELEIASRFGPGLHPDDQVAALVLVDESISQVFRMIEELTGKIVIQQENLPMPLLNFSSRGSMSRSESLLALETLLALNGVSVTSMGNRFLKAVPTASIRFQSPDIIAGSTLAQEPSQRHYSKVFSIKHLSLEEVTQIVNTLQTPGLSTQLILKKANAIMVTDSLTNLQQIERILNRVDVPVQLDSEMVFRTLNFISAKDLKQRIDSMIQGPLRRFTDGETHVEADERTNQIILVTSPNNIPIFERVISSLDVDAAPLTRTEVFYLKHAKADEVAGLVNALVSGQSSATRKSGAEGATFTRGPGEAPADVAVNETPSSGASGDQFSPFITIESDERSNAIIAFGTASDIRYVEDLISKVDVVLAQVKIDVIIAEVNIGDKYNRGIEGFGLNLDDQNEITLGINQLVGKDNAFSNPFTDMPVRIGTTLENFTLNTVFQTAKSDSDVTILSAPTLVTTHNKEAEIAAGEKRPIITASSTDSTGTSLRSQVEMTPIGIKLKFKPLIGSNGVVQLEIQQTIDSVNGTTKIDGNDQPIVGSRSATSYVSVKDGDVIVLGGLQEVETRKSKGKLFLLGQIPLLGDWLFSSKKDEYTTKDLVIFIRPQVIYSTQDADRIGQSYIDRNHQAASIRKVVDGMPLTKEDE